MAAMPQPVSSVSSAFAASGSAGQQRTPLTLRVAHTSDPDDALAWWALRTGRISSGAEFFDVGACHIQEINAACQRGYYDVAAVSSAVYPSIAHNYAILDAGASVGRGYGPALVASQLDNPAQIGTSCVAVPGDLTTGAMLLRLFFPRASTVAMPFDAIAGAVVAGKVEAGVLIHEELLNWSDRGLKLLMCLGNEWTLRTGLPLTVGLVVARRELGLPRLRRINALLRASIEAGLKNRREALAWAMNFSIETRQGVGDKFVEMFTNADTLSLPPDCREALRQLYGTAHEHRLIAAVPPLDIVES